MKIDKHLVANYSIRKASGWQLWRSKTSVCNMQRSNNTSRSGDRHIFWLELIKIRRTAGWEWLRWLEQINTKGYRWKGYSVGWHMLRLKLFLLESIKFPYSFPHMQTPLGSRRSISLTVLYHVPASVFSIFMRFISQMPDFAVFPDNRFLPI